MPLSLRRGKVTALVEAVAGLDRIEVDGIPCISYPHLTGPVETGDEVIVNVQARELELGSGGFDVLYVNLTRGLELPTMEGTHVMKLPYTPVQFAAVHAEEGKSLPESLDGLPVVCCTLHSQVIPAWAGLGSKRRVAYLQIPGGALPVSLSDAIRVLKARGNLTSVAVGACVDGDVSCASTASALAWAAADGCEAVLCAPGPGIVGTGSPLGHGALAAAEALNTAAALGGSPILAARASQADGRERHRGVSHHTRAVLRFCAGEVAVAWPMGYDAPEWLAGREDVDVSGWERACEGLPVEHMGRGPADDPIFFAAAFAAGRVARGRILVREFPVSH